MPKLLPWYRQNKWRIKDGVLRETAEEFPDMKEEIEEILEIF